MSYESKSPQKHAHSDQESAVVKTFKPKKSSQEEQEITEIGGPDGPEPTRYGDWEKKGRCIDF